MAQLIFSDSAQRPFLSPEELTHRAIDEISAALIRIQLLQRRLPINSDGPLSETLSTTASQLIEAGKTLAAIRDALAS